MRCKNCNGDVELKEHISLKKKYFGLKYKKEVIYYCPLCEFENKKEFNISKEDIQDEKKHRLIDKEIELQKAKNIKENKDIKETKYNQTYKRSDT